MSNLSNYSLFREHWKFLAERNATCFAATKAHDGWASIPVAIVRPGGSKPGKEKWEISVPTSLSCLRDIGWAFNIQPSLSG